MKIKVEFYKDTGKYYSGGTADVDVPLWDDNFEQQIVDTQDCLMDGWQNHDFFVRTDTMPDHQGNEFYCHLFMPHHFKGMIKNK